jgi:putative endonuclease
MTRGGSGGASLGRVWETRAACFLAENGIELIAHGYRCRLGELDLVCSDGQTLVVVEVRARQSRTHGRAVETVGPRKQQRIVRATRHFLMRHPAWFARPIRFDVVAIDGIDGPAPRITWVRHAFDAT